MNSDTPKKGLAFKAGGWYIFSSIMLKGVSIITTPIFTRIMSVEDFGITSTFFSWGTILIVFCSLSLSCGIGRAKIDYSNEFDKFIGSMQLLSLIISCCLGIFLISFASVLSPFMEIPIYAVILLAFYVAATPIIDFYQNGTRYKYQYKENIVIGWILSLSSIFLSLGLMLILQGDRAFYRILGSVCPVIIVAAIIVINAVRNGHFVYDKEFWKYSVALSAPLVLHEVAHSILSHSDRIFIAKICGEADTGIYSISYSYGCLILVITNAISNAWLPWFHDMYEEKNFSQIKRQTNKVVLLACYVGLACIAFAPEAIALLGGEQYKKGIYCIPPITMGILCQYMYTHYVNIEIHLKKTKFVPIGTMIAAVSNIVLNEIFIKKYGFIAASYTTFVSYFILMMVHYLYTRLILKIKIYNNLFVFISIVVVSLLSIAISYSFTLTFIRYLIIGMGFVSFLIVNREYIFKRRFFN